MSIYLNLRSSECKDIYSKNHGGNFKNELNEPLRLHGTWEVALAEMTYHAQAFPNLPKEYSTVTVSLKESLQVYNTINKDFHVKTQVKWNGKWVSSDFHEIDMETSFPHVRSLPQKNYDWQDFKDAMTGITKEYVEGRPKPITNLTFTFKEDKLSCTIDSTHRTYFSFSPDLVKFLTLTTTEVYQDPYQNKFTDEISFKMPILPKDKFLIWPLEIEEDLWVQFGDLKIDIPRKSNTMVKFERFIGNMSNNTQYESIISFNLRHREIIGAYQYNFTYKFMKTSDIKLISWSPAIIRMLGFSNIALNYETKQGEITGFIEGNISKIAPYVATLPYTKALGYNFYPTAKTIIDALNKVISDSCGILMSKCLDKHLFSVGEDGVCTFEAHAKIGVKISSYLLKLLHLPNTDATHKGTAYCVMPAASREFLYVHSDMLDSNNYNNGNTVLRVINNDRAVNEKVMVSFPNLYYYPISGRYLSNIQIRITDNHSDEDLPFALEVTTLLHFRQCNNPHFS